MGTCATGTAHPTPRDVRLLVEHALAVGWESDVPGAPLVLTAESIRPGPAGVPSVRGRERPWVRGVMRMATWLRRFTAARPPARSVKPPPPGAEPVRRASRERNLFEAAAAHVAASVEGDEQALEAASARVAPEALMFGISELARRAVVVLAQERGVPPRAVARSLLGLPEG